MRVTSFALIYVAVVFCFFMAGYSARPSLIQPAIQESQRVNAYPAWGVVSVGSGDVFEWNLQDGHGYIVMPEGVIDVGTPDRPEFRATMRPNQPGQQEETPALPKGIQLGQRSE